MKVYVKNKTPKFTYPDDMEKILSYLNEHGKIQVSDETVEKLYYEFSDSHAASWLIVSEWSLESFADYLEGIDL